MLDGPGDLNRIKPRKSLLARRQKRHPLDGAARQKSAQAKFVRNVQLTVAIIFGFILLVSFQADGRPQVLIAIIFSLMIMISVPTLIKANPSIIRVAGLYARFRHHLWLFITKRTKSEQQESRAAYRRDQKANRITSQIEHGAEYTLGDDGELVIIEKQEHKD
jgi:hypothetical protein